MIDDRALCGRFPMEWADRMWGLNDPDEEPESPAKRRVMTAAGMVVCSECPIRMQCLADAIVNPERHGIRGGLGRLPRQRLGTMARATGIDMSKRSAAIDVARWLCDNPNLIGLARDAEAKGRAERRRRETERLQENRMNDIRHRGESNGSQGVLDL